MPFSLFLTNSKLNNLLKPDKQRAYELRCEFEKGFDGIARRIWPNLTHVHGVVTGKENSSAKVTNIFFLQQIFFPLGVNHCRLRVVSNFSNGDCGAGEIHTRACANFRGNATRGERQKFCPALYSSKFRARVWYFARPTFAIAKIRDYSQSTIIESCMNVSLRHMPVSIVLKCCFFPSGTFRKFIKFK